MTIKKFHFVLLIILFIFSGAIQASHDDKEVDTNLYASSKTKKMDLDLQHVYQGIKLKYRHDGLFLKKLAQSQKIWLSFRDAQLEMLFPHSKEANYYGSIFPTCYSTEYANITEDRIKVLERWLNGVPEGETCSGSIKTKS